MSQTIEQKVVQMKFDNRDFERNVSTSMSSLQKFKESLNFKGASKGLDELNHTASKFSFHPLEAAADTVGVKMDAMAVASITAIQRIVNSAIDAGAKIAKSLTIEPVTQGYNEYELKMGSVQTIMASTGASLQEVNGYLEELNKYADQTIYSFSDMTSSIGKFTNAGVPLKDAVLAIQGISNEAALAGANAQQASHAMYNFAQALSSGSVKLIDWKSIENANMATVSFKEELIKTALDLKTLVDTEEGYISTTTNMNGQVSNAFTATQGFNDSLQHQWMTTDVLVKTLARYANREEDIGEAAFAAATEVKTFSQLLDTLKEAVGSGWSQSFELIIGDFNQAKNLLTGISNVVGGLIDAQSDARNKILEEWQNFQGRDDLINAFRNIWKGVESVIKPIKEAIATVIPPLTGKTLADLTAKFRLFTSNLHLSKDAADGLKNIITFILKSFRFSFRQLSSLIPIITNVTGRVFKMAHGFLELFASGKGVPGLFKRIFGNERYEALAEKYATTVDNLSSIFEKLKNGVKKVIDTFKESEFITGILEDIKSKIDSVTDWIYNHLLKAFDKLNEHAGGFTEWASESFHSLLELIKNFKSPSQAFQSLLDWINEVTSKSQFFTWLGSAIKFVRDHVDNLGRSIMAFIKGTNIISFFKGVKDFLTGVKDRFLKFVKSIDLGVLAAYAFSAMIMLLIFSLSQLSGAGATLVKSLAGMLDSIGDYFKAKKLESYSKSLVGFALALGILTAILLALTMLDYDVEKLKYVAIVMLVVAAAIVGLYYAMVKIGNLKKEKVYDPRKGLVQALNNFVDGLKDSMRRLAKAMAFKNIAKGIMLLIVDLVLLGLAIKALVMMDVWGDLQNNEYRGLKSVLAVFVGLLALAGIIRLAGKSALSVSVSILVLIFAVKLMANLFEKFAETKSKVWTAIGAVAIIVLLLGVMAGIPILVQALATKLGGGQIERLAKGLGKTMIALSASLLIMVGVVKLLSNMVKTDLGALWGAIGALAVLVVIIGLMVLISHLGGPKITKFGGTLILISIALAAMVGVLKLITMLVASTSVKDTWIAVGILAALVALMAALMAVSSLTGKAKVLPIIAIMLMVVELFGILIVLLVFPLDRLITAAITMALVLGAVAVLFVAMASLGDVKKIGGLLIGLIGAIALLLVVMVGLATLAAMNIDAANMIAIGGAIALIFLSIAGALAIASKAASIGGVAAMLAMTLSLIVVAVALYALCQYDWPQILTAAIGLSLVMAVLALVCTIAAGGFAGAAALVIVSVGIIALAYALTLIQDIDLGHIFDGLMAIGIALGIIIVAAYAVQGCIVGLIALVVGLAGIAGVAILCSVAVEFVTQALLVFTGALPIVIENLMNAAIAFTLFVQTLADNADDIGYAAIAIAENLIAGLLKGLYHGVELVVEGVGFLCGNIVDFFCSFFDSHSPSRLMEDLALTLTDGMALGIDEGTPTVMTAMDGLGNSIASRFSDIKDFFVRIFSGSGEEAGDAMINTTSDTIASKEDKVADAVDRATNNDKIDKRLEKNEKHFNDSGKSMGGSLADGVASEASKAWQKYIGNDGLFKFDTTSMNTTINTTLDQFSGLFKNGGETGATSFFTELSTEFDGWDYSSMTGNIENMLGDFGGQFSAGGLDSITQYTNGFGSGETSLLTTISGLGGSGVSSMNEYTDDYYSVGEDSVDGFIKGANSKMPNVHEVGLSVAKEFITSLKEGLTSHSPSKKAMAVGTDTTSGYVIGILNGLKSVSDSADEVGTTAMSALVNSVSSLEDRINDNLDVQPTIRPVMDLSEIQRGTTTLDSLIYPTETFKMASVNDHMINATLDARTAIPTNEAVVYAINKLHDDFGDLQDSNTRLFDFLDHYIPELGNMQVVMDSGAVVGQIGSKMDSRLGSYAMRQRRQ